MPHTTVHDLSIVTIEIVRREIRLRLRGGSRRHRHERHQIHPLGKRTIQCGEIGKLRILPLLPHIQLIYEFPLGLNQ